MSKIDKSVLDGLYAAKLLTGPEYAELLRRLTPGFNIKRWFAAVTGLLGAVLFLCGVVFFFAYNWADMGKFLRLTLPLLGLLGCAGMAFYKKIQTPAGQVFGFGAALFIGVFMAVYGQTYQTGAFVYELFFNWALLMLPLALVAKNRWLWLMWMTVVNIYAAAYLEFANATRVFYVLGGLNLFFYAVEECCYYRTKASPVYGLFIFLPLLSFVTVYGMLKLAGVLTSVSFPFHWAAVGFAVAAGYYGYRRNDILITGSSVLSLDLLLTVKLWVWEKYFFTFFDHALSFLALYVLSAYGVYYLYKKMKEAAHAD